MAEKRRSLGLKLEMYGPFVCGVLTMILLVYFSSYIAAKFESKDWNSAGLYSAIFGWSAIQTGFAFGVFGFVLGKNDGFVAALKGTKTLHRFELYIQRANWTGFVLTFVSIPLIVTEPSAGTALSSSYLVVAGWFSFFIWSFLAFLRLAYNFGAIASVKDKVFHGA